MKDYDFSYIPERQEEIDRRLNHWAIWVVPRRQSWKTQPMFRLFRSDMWHGRQDKPRLDVNPLECHETEQAVSLLPERHRYAIRWCYVAPWVPPNVVRRELACTRESLAVLISDGRDMLKNRLLLKSNA